MTAAHTPARDPRNWRTEHALMQATIDARRELAQATARIAPPPTGSREIPRWLLAVLMALALLCALTFAPGAHAAIKCQGDQEYYAQVSAESPAGASTWWTDCGYRYDWPSPPLIAPPVIDPPVSPVPEPAGWMMFAAGGLVCAVAAHRRRKGHAS